MGKNKKNSGSKTRDWIIRGVIFGVLGVVLVLALLDNRAKQQAEATSTAFDELLKDANENSAGILLVETLKDSIVGSPERTVNNIAFQDIDLIYNWKGIFREYKVIVNVNSAEDHGTVESIGLGKEE